MKKSSLAHLVISAMLSMSGQAAMAASQDSFSPYVNESLPRQVLWGDTHLHTRNSADAGFLNYRIGPEEAFRLAKGEQINANGGLPVKLVRPLDFLVVADHSEYLGLVPALFANNPEVLKTEAGQRWSQAIKSRDFKQIFGAAMELIHSASSGEELIKIPAFSQSVWQQANAIADAQNEPGKFTAFIGFEWTSMPDQGSNLHRVVVFKDGADKADQVLPYTAFKSFDPEDLWQYMEDYENKTGGNVLAIPHNSNLSNGKMFAVETYKGEPITAEYAKERQKWEPLLEITQMKGDSETHPLLSPNDEFADFGSWDKVSLDGTKVKEPWMLQYEYARSALKNGMKLEQSVGENPFKYGFIGSTDSHTGLATTREENFFGKHSGLEPTPKRFQEKIINSPLGDKYTTWGWEQMSGGLAAVWAEENSRASIFDAMERKEVYATTGTRITLRMFAGWDFDKQDVTRPDRVEVGYKKGVPMGGDLPDHHDKVAPTLMIWASKDPDGANLDRIQIIKGWIDDKGNAQERVYDVAWSGNRSIKADGSLPEVGNTVNEAEASYTNDIGDTSLEVVWQDPDFSASQNAFYYTRVLEIPTPSWLLYDQKRFNIQVPQQANKIIQERAYSSPVWYSPKQ